MKPKYKKGDYVKIGTGLYKITRKLPLGMCFNTGISYSVNLVKDFSIQNKINPTAILQAGPIEETEIKRKITNKKELMVMLI